MNKITRTIKPCRNGSFAQLFIDDCVKHSINPFTCPIKYESVIRITSIDLNEEKNKKTT